MQLDGSQDILDVGGDSTPNRHQVDPPPVADASPATGTDVPRGAGSLTPGTKMQGVAPSHDPEHHHPRKKAPGEGTPSNSAREIVRRRADSGDGGGEEAASNEVTPPSLARCRSLLCCAKD